jgi:hypothetical protein
VRFLTVGAIGHERPARSGDYLKLAPLKAVRLPYLRNTLDARIRDARCRPVTVSRQLSGGAA